MDVEDYLLRIGAVRPEVPDLAALRELQRRHLEAVPFENLAGYLGERVDLAPGVLLDKIVRRRRGGLCYELNGAFAWLLREVGFDVQLLAGRVMRRTGAFGPPLDHLALRVELDEPWLVDVGYGRFSLAPLRFGTSAVQVDPAGRFTVEPAPHGDVDVVCDGAIVYRLESRPRELDEFAAMAWFHTNSPDSPFTRGPTCSRATPDGRVTVAGSRLLVTTGERRSEAVLAGDAGVLAAYREHFGLRLDRVPSLVTILDCN
ncbi:arylamine N-acetyltransferase [Amycolatopsis rhabdoformis]|uniref:Arylamine N-acetyltransferase n=1 Tax=Amycolatopsis rhabdoformis TaxID=1448059 RepID=A0ABZ1HVU4_9PSEU|nr:arylamine N-acetyltransferase [Amycolatopsis rhabdoformis]WSE26338.1 arylamine N-acetyltransferase [Amycolatopsis rhabdoformis]